MKKLGWILAYLAFLSLNAQAGLPPTTAKGQADASASVTFNLQAPNSQSTRINGTTALIETGNSNLLANPSFEAATPTSWTASAGTLTAQTATIKSDAGKQAASWVLSAATGSVSQDVTPSQPLTGVNLEASCWVNTTATTFQLCSRQAGSEIQCSAIPSTGSWQKVSLNWSGPSSGSIGVDVSTTGSTTGTLYVDQCYVGSATNLAQASQATIWGGIEWTAGDNTWQVTQTSYAALFSASGTNGTAFGSASAPGTAVPSIVANNMPPSDYKITFANFSLQSPSGVTAKCQLGDGSGRLAEVATQRTSAGDTQSVTITARVTYSVATTKTYSIACLSASGAVTLQTTTGSYALIEKFPSTSQTVLGPDATAASWSGYHDSTCAWNTTSATMTDPAADTSCTLVQRTNRNFGTVASLGGSNALPGITFTPPKVGRYLVKASTTGRNSAGAGSGYYYRLVDGSGNQLDFTGWASPGASYDTPVVLSGILDVSSIASTTVKVQIQSNGVASTSLNSSAGTSLEWSIAQLDSGQPAPLLTDNTKQVVIGTAQTADGSVTSTTYADLTTNQPTLTFTATKSAKYKIWCSLMGDSSATTGFFRINNSVGAATVNFNQDMGQDTTSVWSNYYVYEIATLTKGVSYTFTLQGKSASGSVTVHSSGPANGIAIVAEQME